MDPESTKAANGAAEERQSQLFDDLRKRNERRAHGARPIVPEMADRPGDRQSTRVDAAGGPRTTSGRAPDDGASHPTLDASTPA